MTRRCVWQQSLAGEARGSTPCSAKVWQSRRQPTLVDGKQLPAVFRIKALWRLHCCALLVLCWGGVGASGSHCAGGMLGPPGNSPRVTPVDLPDAHGRLVIGCIERPRMPLGQLYELRGKPRHSVRMALLDLAMIGTADFIRAGVR